MVAIIREIKTGRETPVKCSRVTVTHTTIHLFYDNDSSIESVPREDYELTGTDAGD